MRKIRSLVVFMLTFLMGIMLFACAKTSNYKFSRVDWKEDGTSATVVLVDESDSSKTKEVSVEVILKERKSATCDERAKDVYEVTYEGVTYTKEISVGKALGHEWEFVEFKWSADFKSASAILVCKRDSAHTKEVEVTVTSKVKTDPTCGEKGVTTYTATYETHTESKDVADIDTLNHDYQFDHFVWNDDFTATAVLVCQNDNTHIKEKNAVVTSKIVTPATCEEKGLKEYTATYLTFSETKSVEIEALGHNYQFDHFEWAEDCKSASAVLVCKNDSTHIIKELATVESAVKTPATCEAKGVTTYTAKYEEHTETKELEDIEALGHKYEFDHFIWAEDYKSAKVVLVCENNNTHTKEENATVVEQEYEEYTSYTATYGNFSETRKVSKTSEEIYTVDFRNANNELISTADYKLGDTVVVPANPTMDDEIYTYIFKSWNKEVSLTANGSVTYKAVYEKAYKEYEIKFVNSDDEVISTTTYHYGDTVVVPTEGFKKAADETYTYTFKSWDSEVVAVDGNKTYKAVYEGTYIEYQAIYLNYDGSEVYSVKYHYGETVTCPITPERPANEVYEYDFDSWTSETNGLVTTYTAKYDAYEVVYFVSYIDSETGLLIDCEAYFYNEEYILPTLTKPADNTYTYEFDRILEEVAPTVTETVTYTVVFAKTYIEYEITFVDYDDTVISQKNYHYGDTVVLPETPTRESDFMYDYTFNRWAPQVETEVQCNRTYTALYTYEFATYTHVYLSYDGTEVARKTSIFNTKPVAPEAPEKPADKTYTYRFTRWTDSDPVDYVFTHTAEYVEEYIIYAVIFVNDGKVISNGRYHYGDLIEVPTYVVKDKDNTYTYEFTGWDKTVPAKAEEDATFTATYKATYIDYEITFKNYDNKVLSQNTYHYGDDIVVPEVDELFNTDTKYYEFANWGKELELKVVGSQEYKACYNEFDRYPQDISFKTLNKVYDREPYSPTFTVVGDGDYTIKYTVKGEDNFTLIAPKALGQYTMQITFEETTKCYASEVSYDFDIAYEANPVISFEESNYLQIIVEFDRFGHVIKTAGLDDLGQLYVDKANLLGKDVFEFVEAYNNELAANGYDKLYDFLDVINDTPTYDSIPSIKIFPSLQPNDNSSFEEELAIAIDSLKEPVGKYIINGSNYIVSYLYGLLLDIDDFGIEDRVDKAINALANIKSEQLKFYYKMALYFNLSKNVTNYYIDILDEVEGDEALNHVSNLKKFRDVDNGEYLDYIYNCRLGKTHKALETQAADARGLLMHALYDFDDYNDIKEYSDIYRKTITALSNYRNHYQTNTPFGIYAFNSSDIQAYVTNKDFQKFVANYFDKEAYNAAINKAFEDALVAVNNCKNEHLDQNVYELDQYVIAGTNMYHYIDNAAGLTYIFNEYKFESETNYLGYIIDGKYTKEEAFDSTINKRVLDILICKDDSYYISYENYRGYDEFIFDFYNESFSSYEGDFLYIAHITGSNGKPYTIRFNVDGATSRCYMYLGNWTYDELLKRVTEAEYFYVNHWWEYDDEGFVVFNNYEFKYIFEVDSDDDHLLNECLLDFEWKNVEFNYFYKTSSYTYAFVTIDDSQYLFYYDVNANIDDIKNLLVRPVFGLNGTFKWTNDDGIITASNDPNVCYEITDKGLEEVDPSAVRSETLIGTYETNSDEYKLILRKLNNGYKSQHVLINDEEKEYYSWLDTGSYYILAFGNDVIALLVEDDGKLVKFDYDKIEKKLLYSGYDYSGTRYFVIYESNDFILANMYSKMNGTVEETLKESPLCIIVPMLDTDAVILVTGVGLFAFEIDGTTLTEFVMPGYHTVVYENYDGTVVEKYIASDEAVGGIHPTCTRDYDDKYYYEFADWIKSTTETGVLFTASYNKFLRQQTGIMYPLSFTGKVSYTGQEIEPILHMSNNDAEPIIEYAKKGSRDYVEGMPTELGNYVIRITYPDTEKYIGTSFLVDLTVQLDNHQIVLFHYLSAVTFEVDGIGTIVQVYTLDSDVAYVIKEADLIGKNVVDASVYLVDTFAEAGLFDLIDSNTEDHSALNFWVAVYAAGDFKSYFAEQIDAAIAAELSDLGLDINFNLYEPNIVEKYLKYFTLLSDDEMAKLTPEEAMYYVIKNTSATQFKSYGYNEFVVNLEPIYTFRFELRTYYDLVRKYNSTDNLLGYLDEAISDIGVIIGDLMKNCEKTLSNNNIYTYYRNDYYNMIKGYINAYKNNDEIALGFYSPGYFMQTYDTMLAKDSELGKLINEGFNKPTEDTKLIRAGLFGNESYMSTLANALKANDTTLEEIHNQALAEFLSIMQEQVDYYDYDLDEMPHNLRTYFDKYNYYLINTEADETWIFTYVNIAELIAAGYQYICYVYAGQFTLDQFKYMDNPKLLRFARYDTLHIKNYYELDIYNFANPYLAMAIVEEGKTQARLPFVGRGELQYVAQIDFDGDYETLALFEDNGEKVAAAYLGKLSYDDVLNRRIPLSLDAELEWSENNGIYYIKSDSNTLAFVLDESGYLVPLKNNFKKIELKYSYSEGPVIYAYVVADGKNCLFIYLGDTQSGKITKEAIEAGEGHILSGEGGYITWELINDKALVASIDGEVVYANYVSLDDQTQEYTFTKIEEYDIASYEVAYTYTNETSSYLMLKKYTYYGDVKYKAYKFDGVLTENQMIEEYLADNYDAIYEWLKVENTISLIDDSLNNATMFEIVDGVLKEVVATSPKAFALIYGPLKFYLISDKYGYVTNIYGENDLSVVFVERYEFTGMYIMDAFLEIIKCLDAEGYFKLFIDNVVPEFAEYDVTIHYISDVNDKDTLFAGLEEEAHKIRKNINVTPYIIYSTSYLQTITNYNDAEIAKIDGKEALNQIIKAFNYVGSFRTDNYKAIALYLEPIYKFVRELRELDSAINLFDEGTYTEEKSYISNAYSQVGSYIDQGLVAPGGVSVGSDKWSFVDYLFATSTVSQFFFEKNKYFNTINAMLDAIQSNSDYRLERIDSSLAYDPTKYADLIENELQGIYKALETVRYVKEKLYENVSQEVLDAIYAKIYETTDLTKEDLEARIEKEYRNIIDDNKIDDINVCEANKDFVMSLNSMFTLEYLYIDVNSNQTLAFIKWESDTYTALQPNGKPYCVCYIFDGLLTSNDLFDDNVDKTILRFCEYEKSYGYVHLLSQYLEDAVGYKISNDEVYLEMPKSKLQYVGYRTYKNETFTYGLYEGEKAYEYLGKYTFRQIESGCINITNEETYPWQFVDSDSIVIWTGDCEAMYILGDDGNYYEYKPDFTKLDVIYVAETAYETLVLVVDEDDNQYAFSYEPNATLADIEAGNVLMYYGVLKDYIWYIDENESIIIENKYGSIWVVIEITETGLEAHYGDDLINSRAIGSYLGPDESILFTYLYTYAGTLQYAYIYPAGTSYSDMVDDYLLGNYCNDVYRWTEIASTMIVHNDYNNTIYYLFVHKLSGFEPYVDSENKVLEYVYYSDTKIYACYDVDGAKICYEFNGVLLSPDDLAGDLSNYTYNFSLWDIDRFDRITIGNIEKCFTPNGMNSKELRIVNKIKFDSPSEIKYVLYHPMLDATYILFVNGGERYIFVYDGKVTDKAFGVLDSVAGDEGELRWAENNGFIVIFSQNAEPIGVVQINGEYVFVDQTDIMDYQITYKYVYEDGIYVFVDAINYNYEPVKDVFGFGAGTSDESIEKFLAETYNPYATYSTDLTWDESGTAVFMYLAKVQVFKKFHIQGDTLVEYKEVEAKDHKYYYYDTDKNLSYALSIENGLNICYEYNGNDFSSAPIKSYYWKETKWGNSTIIDCGAYPNSYFTILDDGVTLEKHEAYTPSNPSGGIIIKPISGGGQVVARP